MLSEPLRVSSKLMFVYRDDIIDPGFGLSSYHFTVLDLGLHPLA